MMRYYLNIFSWICLLLFLIFNSNTALAQYGAQANPTGNPIGGGQGYSDIITSGDYTVSKVSELLNALNQAQSGEVVYISPNATIDLTDQNMLIIPDYVTLAGNRGLGGSLGPLIFTNGMANSSYLFRMEEGSRFTGLRVRGPDEDFSDITYDLSPFGSNELSNAKCIIIRGADVNVDNNEISNFHRVGVDVQKNATDLNIHHNHLHDIHAYPVFVAGESYMPIVIEANTIEWIWHATAGTGDPGTGYEARYNIFIAKPIPESWYSAGSHAIDMHPDVDIEDSRGDLVAADLIDIHHNTFLDQSGTHPTIVNLEDAKIRGLPRVMASFYRNIFQNADPSLAVTYSGDPGNIWVYDNLYGPENIQIGIAEPTTPQIILNSLPLPDKTVPVLNQDTIPIDIEIVPIAPLQVTRVEIEVNNELIYDGSIVPIELYITGTSLHQALPHNELIVRATDSNNGIATYKTVFELASGNGGSSPHPLEIIYGGVIPLGEVATLPLGRHIQLPPNFQVDLGGEFEIKAGGSQ